VGARFSSQRKTSLRQRRPGKKGRAWGLPDRKEEGGKKGRSATTTCSTEEKKKGGKGRGRGNNSAGKKRRGKKRGARRKRIPSPRSLLFREGRTLRINPLPLRRRGIFYPFPKERKKRGRHFPFFGEKKEAHGEKKRIF